MSVHGWHTLVGKCVFGLVVFVSVVGCSAGSPNLSELQPGDCTTGQPYLYPPDIELIDCSEANPVTDTMVVFAEGAEGESYPGNLEEMSARCAGEGGFFLEPSSETWNDGDRIGLCSTSVEMGKYRDFGQSSSSPEPDAEESEPHTEGTIETEIIDNLTLQEVTAEDLDASEELREAFVTQKTIEVADKILEKLESSQNFNRRTDSTEGYESLEWIATNYEKPGDEIPEQERIGVIRGVFEHAERETITFSQYNPETEEGIHARFIVEGDASEVDVASESPEAIRDYINSGNLEGSLKANDIQFTGPDSAYGVNLMTGEDTKEGELLLNTIEQIEEKLN